MTAPTPPTPPAAPDRYAARLEVDRPETLDRVRTAFRPILIIPIAIVLNIVAAETTTTWTDGSDSYTTTGGGIMSALALATGLLILFRQRYPRWWFDFAREFTRFSARVLAYAALLRDEYPSTEDEQAVHLEIDYPDVEADLNRWLPLVKWFLAIPHYVVLVFLWIGAWVVVVIAWFAILITGKYPEALFRYVVGVGRWTLRVHAYAFLLVTDRYPPFRLAP